MAASVKAPVEMAARVRLDQRVDDRPRRVVPVRMPVAGHEHDVRPGQRVKAVRDGVRQAVPAGHQPGGRPAHPYLVRHARPGREHLCGDADVQWLGTLADEDGDTVQTGE